MAFKGIVIQSFNTKKTQNGVNKWDKIMHSQRGKGIFSQFKKYLQKYIDKIDAHCRSVVHTIVDHIK